MPRRASSARACSFHASACAAICPAPSAATCRPRSSLTFPATHRTFADRVDITAASHLFDLPSAPANDRDRRHDFLSWLATWIGVTFDRSWPTRGGDATSEVGSCPARHPDRTAQEPAALSRAATGRQFRRGAVLRPLHNAQGNVLAAARAGAGALSAAPLAVPRPRAPRRGSARVGRQHRQPIAARRPAGARQRADRRHAAQVHAGSEARSLLGVRPPVHRLRTRVLRPVARGTARPGSADPRRTAGAHGLIRSSTSSRASASASSR